MFLWLWVRVAWPCHLVFWVLGRCIDARIEPIHTDEVMLQSHAPARSLVFKGDGAGTDNCLASARLSCNCTTLSIDS